MSTKNLEEIFYSTKRLSTKNSSYFSTYEHLFSEYIGKSITFVEVGVFNGGSLHMWREYFGPQARIIGVDLNPIANELKKDGFEIYIGNQEDLQFWEFLKKNIGPIDILLDDGGHKNGQQIRTLFSGIELMGEKGLIVIEDVHTSYFRRFGNPSPLSFISFSKKIIDQINSRFKFVKSNKTKFYDLIWSVAFYESIVAFHIDKKKSIEGIPVVNQGGTLNAVDYRNNANPSIESLLIVEKFIDLHRPFFISKNIVHKIFDVIIYCYETLENLKLLKYFSKK
jgi:hypothetical protein